MKIIKLFANLLLIKLSGMLKYLYSIVNPKSFFNFSNCIFLFSKLKIKGSVSFYLKSGFVFKSKFIINGKNNKIIFEDGVKITNCYFLINGNNCTIRIKGNRVINNSKFELLDSNTHLFVDENTGFNNNRIVIAGFSNYIEIGKGCIFAENAELWSSDTHSILDLETRKRINNDLPIIIGNNVWIGNRVIILKGVTIKDDVIVAAGSIVTKSINKNTLVGGLPAKTLRTNIYWDINRL